MARLSTCSDLVSPIRSHHGGPRGGLDGTAEPIRRVVHHRSRGVDAMKEHDHRVATFQRLHSSGCFVMPNPWDAGSARALEQLGFKALATTSAGFAWTLGRADNQVRLDQALEHLRVIADAVKVPVNADFEGGFAGDPEQVGANV